MQSLKKIYSDKKASIKLSITRSLTLNLFIIFDSELQVVKSVRLHHCTDAMNLRQDEHWVDEIYFLQCRWLCGFLFDRITQSRK